jgi:hypothetical protein
MRAIVKKTRKNPDCCRGFYQGASPLFPSHWADAHQDSLNLFLLRRGDERWQKLIDLERRGWLAVVSDPSV